MMMQPAENLTKDQELALGERIQRKLSVDAALVLETLTPEEAIASNQEDLNRGLAALEPSIRRGYSSALAQNLNRESDPKKLMEWASAFEYFTADDMAFLQAGWSDKLKKSFNSALDRGKYEASVHAETSGFDAATRRFIQRDGDKAAYDLVRSNILLVRSMAHEFKRRMPASPEHEEIFAMGMIGLWKAARKYDPRRGNKFSTVAYNWIRQSIVREINNTHRLVRLPENRVGDYIAISRLRREFKDQEDLTEAEFESYAAEKLGLTHDKIREINNAAGNHASLNKTVGDEDGEKELIHYVAKSAPAAEEIAIETEMQTILNMALSDLEPLELEIVVSSFKISYGAIEHRTVKAICADASISPSQYRRISAGAMRKIKDHMDSYGVGFADFFS